MSRDVMSFDIAPAPRQSFRASHTGGVHRLTDAGERTFMTSTRAAGSFGAQLRRRGCSSRQSPVAPRHTLQDAPRHPRGPAAPARRICRIPASLGRLVRRHRPGSRVAPAWGDGFDGDRSGQRCSAPVGDGVVCSRLRGSSEVRPSTMMEPRGAARGFPGDRPGGSTRSSRHATGLLPRPVEPEELAMPHRASRPRPTGRMTRNGGRGTPLSSPARRCRGVALFAMKPSGGFCSMAVATRDLV